jgi:hypothetical protein
MRHITLGTKPEERPRLCFSRLAYMKMLHIVMTSPVEIAWHGAVTRNPENPLAFDVERVYLFPQTRTAATVSVDEEEYAVWFAELAKNKGDVLKHRLHGHSHVNMGVAPSSVDRGYRDSLTRHYKTQGDNFYIFLILNKSGDWDIEIHDMRSLRVYDTADVDVVVGGSPLRHMNEEIEEAVSSRAAPTPPQPGLPRQNNYYTRAVPAGSGAAQAPRQGHSYARNELRACKGCALEDEEELCWEQMQRTPKGQPCRTDAYVDTEDFS